MENSHQIKKKILEIGPFEILAIGPRVGGEGAVRPPEGVQGEYQKFY